MSEWERELEQKVEETRITLVNSREEEYDFLVLDEFCCRENRYLALVPCDEKTDPGSGNDPGESNDITVVRVGEADGRPMLFAVTDAEELYGVAKLVEERFGHLGGEKQETMSLAAI